MTNPATRAFLATCTLAVAGIAAPIPTLAQDLPDANTLIADYVAAIGGAERYGGQSSVVRGTFSMPAMGMEGSFVLVQRYPDQMRMDVSLPGVGEIQSGYTGEVGWSLNPMVGAQLMDGAELEQMREQSSVAASLRDPAVVPGRETVERAEFGGEACWRVRLTWASGRESHDCYSVDTGLLVASESVQASPMGDVPSVTLFRDYREFDGRRMPTRMIQSAMGQEQVMVIETVDYGEVSDDQVAPPQQIRALIDG
ncbi:MAG: hypothetical protein EA350_05020 [Gemmatimonadales bacterium]|nr:MAG: hypothetical protein EA350_05020 [Gemmatimonadales bacterium]